MTAPNPAELARLDAAATSGPWFQQAILVHGPDQGGFDIGPVLGWHDWSDTDARLIVFLRNHVPDFLAAIEERDRLAAALREVAKWDCLDFDEGDCFTHDDDTRCAICLARAALEAK